MSLSTAFRPLLAAILLLAASAAFGDETNDAGNPQLVGSVLSGTVVGADGIALPDARVIVAEGPPTLHFMKRTAQSATLEAPAVLAAGVSDRSGKFSLTLPAEAPETGWRRWRLAVWCYHSDASVAIRLIDRDWTRAGLPLAIVLGRASETNVRLIDPDGKAAAGVRVAPQRVAGGRLPAALADRLAATTDSEGNATIRGVSNEALETVEVESQAFGVQWIGLPRPDAANRSTLTLAPVGRLSGRLTADEPQAVRRARVRVATWLVPDDEDAGGGLADIETDDAGRFDVPAIAAGSLAVAVEPTAEPAYLSVQNTGPQVDPGATTHFDIPLRRATRVTQQVVDRDDQRPVAGVLVLLQSWQANGGRGITDAEGRLTAYVLPGTVSPLAARMPAPYYYPESALDSRSISEQDVEVSLNALRLSRGAMVKGVVVDDQGRSLSGAEVIGFWPMARRGDHPVRAWTNAAGEFVIEGVDPQAELRLWASHGEAVSAEPTRATPNSGALSLVIAPNRAVSLDGRVVDTNGKPVADARVRVFAWQRQLSTSGYDFELGSVLFAGVDWLRTDAEGRFHTPRSLRPDAAYSLEVTARGMLPAETEAIEPSSPRTTKLSDVVLNAAPRLRTIVGRIVDAQSRGVAGATVWQSGDGPRRTETHSDDLGRFQLSGVFDGPAFVFARKDGFGLAAAKISADDESCELTLRRHDEPRRELRKSPRSMSVAEERALCLKLIEPALPKLREPAFEAERFRLLETLARVDATRALETADTILTNPRIKEIVRSAVAAGLVDTDPEQALEVAETLAEPWRRAQIYMKACDAVSDDAPDRKAPLLDEALVHVRGEADPGHKAYMLGQVAERWLDLGNRDRGVTLLREAQTLAEQLPAPSETTQKVEAVHMRGRFSGSLARVDGPAALALVAGFDPPYRDWYRADVARGLAGHDPAEAERLFNSLEGLKFTYGLAVLHRMAPADAERAARLARSYSSAEEQSYALGIVSHALAAADRQTAERLLEEAYATLERAQQRGDVKSRSQLGVADIAAALLPIVERVDPSRVEESLWRSLALRSARPARGDPSGAHEFRTALLAAFVARYDRDAARRLLAPLSARFSFQEPSFRYLLIALAATDGLWASELTESLPEAPSGVERNPRKIVRSLLAEQLGHSDRELSRMLYQSCGLRDPDLRDEER